MSDDETSARRLALAQAAYYGLTGIWPFVDIQSFERITGPKRDRWLVYTVGAVVTAVGASLALAARGNPRRPETVTVATGTAAGLGAVDVTYVAKGTISPMYLVDALAQAAFIAGWVRFSATGDG